jgi:hypothetical protein
MDHDDCSSEPSGYAKSPAANTVPGILSSSLAVASAPFRSSQLAMSPAPTRTATDPLDAAFFVVGVDLVFEELWAARDAVSNRHRNTVKSFIGPQVRSLPDPAVAGCSAVTPVGDYASCRPARNTPNASKTAKLKS